MAKYIHAADLHLKRSVPVCRLEDERGWLDVQERDLRALKAYTLEHDANLLLVGDIFDSPVASISVVTMFLDVFLPIKDRVFILAGNHDLRGNNYENVEDSSYAILKKSFKEIPDMEVVGGHHFNEPYSGEHKIVCTHQLVFNSEDEVAICGTGKTASMILKEYPHADLIFTGDMHTRFIHGEEGRFVLNSGCMNRQTIKYEEYKPTCFLVDTDSGDISALEMPDTEAEISTTHRDRVAERDERIANLLEISGNIGENGIEGLDFIANLEAQIGPLPPDVERELTLIIQEIKEKE